MPTQVKLPSPIEFVFSEDDYFKFNYYNTWSSPKRKFYRVRSYLRPIFILSIVVFMLYRFTGQFGMAEYIILGSGLLLSISYSLLIKDSIRKNVAKIFASGSKSLGGIKEMQFTLDALHVKDNLSKSETNWKSFIELVETEEHFFLLETIVYAVVIPKRAIKTEGELNELRNFLRSKIKNL